MGLYPGGDLFSDPCLTDEDAGADVPVGPTVDDLVTALVDHPLLDVTDPVDVTLAGYSGTYLDLTIPDDISACVRYKPMGPHIYAQGPGQRWHMWILDVDGVRVLVETNDYAGTSAERLAEEQAIIESLVITRWFPRYMRRRRGSVPPALSPLPVCGRWKSGRRSSIGRSHAVAGPDVVAMPTGPRRVADDVTKL
jgi:hypothetical protein